MLLLLVPQPFIVRSSKSSYIFVERSKLSLCSAVRHIKRKTIQPAAILMHTFATLHFPNGELRTQMWKSFIGA